MDLLEENGKGDLPGLTSRILLEFESEEMAEEIYNAIRVDNYQFITCRREGRRIMCESSSPKVSSLLHTLDDFLVCVITAERVYQSI